MYASHAHHQPLSFSVAGMSTSTPLNQSTSSTTMNASTSYRSGYMLSSSTSSSPPEGNDSETLPIIPSKAKIPRKGDDQAHFGMDSMFGPSSGAHAQEDEDAPPMLSLNDLSSSMASSSSFTPRRTPRPPVTPAPDADQTTYLIVYGYPPDKYTLTVDFFASLSAPGATTEPELNPDISNCFRIGFRNAGDAGRAVRRDGEVIGGRGGWMVGVKWAEGYSQVQRAPSFGNSMDVDPPTMQPQQQSIGTPIRLGPASSVFRAQAPTTPRQSVVGPVAAGAPAPAGPAGQKGVLGQVSDLIFGW